MSAEEDFPIVDMKQLICTGIFDGAVSLTELAEKTDEAGRPFFSEKELCVLGAFFDEPQAIMSPVGI